jgi:hypothetical protein
MNVLNAKFVDASIGELGLAIVMIMITTGITNAQETRSPGAGYSQYSSSHHGKRQDACSGQSTPDCDRKRFDESGTIGRMGLGADPAHPEGAGNISN